jgi:hypothetical protein
MRNRLCQILAAASLTAAASCAVGGETISGYSPVRPGGDAGTVDATTVDAAASEAGAGSSYGSGEHGPIGMPGSTGPDAGGEPAACAADSRKAETFPLDMFIMMDQSSSMSATVAGGVQWDLIVSALSQFLMDPGSAGMSAGIQYFGLDDGSFNWFGLNDTISCNAADYAKPDVPITLLPGGASAIVDSLHRHGPTGNTPTTPALQGAIEYATTWATQNPTHRVVVVLATDGIPNGCSSTVAGVAAVAKMGAEASTKIPTYVIGVGPEVVSLDQVAVAGGTGKALIVDTSQDASKSFLAAMNSVRNAAQLPCELQIPSPKSGESPDFDKVNVAYTPGSGPDAGKRTTILRVPDETACDPAAGGWYYDDPQAPTKMNLCDATCSTVTSDSSGKVDVLVGCKTLTVIR